MADRQDNSGVLFRNDKKTKDNQPDYYGYMMVNGIDKNLAAWVKEKNGKKYFSLKLSDKQQTQNNNSQSSEPLPF